MLKMANILITLFLFFSFGFAISDEQIEINADQFTYDKDNTRIFATGNVEILDEKFKLYADKVFLNNSSKVLSAQDNVKIFNSDGTILKTEKIVADQSLHNAIINNNFLYIPNNNYEYNEKFLKLASKRVERRSRYWEKLDNAVFTACDICYNKKTKQFEEPLIQFKAKKVVHDKKRMDVTYYDTFVEFKGKSFFYLPYFSMASPLVKRKSGFLAPNFFQSHYFGFGSDLPYYFVIDDHQDITLKPKFSMKKNPVFFLEHRKIFENGEINTEFSGTIENQEINQLKTDKKRGHIKSKGSFDISKNSYIDFEVHRTTDRNYLNTYKYGYSDTLQSNVKLRGFRKNNYYSLESHIFQDLRKDFSQKEVPKILPRLVLDLNSKETFNKLNYETNVEVLNILRSEGVDNKKFFFNQNIKFPLLFNDGTILEFGGHINAGLYHLDNFDNPVTGHYENNTFRTNFFPQFTVALTKPYFKNTNLYSTILTPKVLFVSGHKNAYNRKIPNEDNLNFDFDISDLFNRNRLSGNDRHDDNSRIDYGFSFLKNGKDSKQTVIEIGQSFHLEKQKYLPIKSGINDKLSNIVGLLAFNPSNLISLNSFFSIEKDNFSLEKAYTNFSLQTKSSEFSFKNIYAPPVINNDGTSEIERKNQFSLDYTQKLSEFWNFTTSTTFDKKNKIKFHNYGLKLRYEDECLGLSFAWNRKYTYNPEDPTSNDFTFLFSFKEIMENDL